MALIEKVKVCLIKIFCSVVTFFDQIRHSSKTQLMSKNQMKLAQVQVQSVIRPQEQTGS